MARRKGRLSWYAWYPEDFAGDEMVRLMSPPGRGAYRELLDYAWRRGPITNPEQCLRAWGWDPALWVAEIRCCWTENAEGCWTQPRLERERLVAMSQADGASRAGKASAASMTPEERAARGLRGAQQRWERRRAEAKMLTEQAKMLTECLGDANSPPPPPDTYLATLGKSARTRAGDPSPASNRLRDCEGILADEFPQLAIQPGVAAAWSEWLAYRRERRKRVSVQAARKQLRDGTTWGAPRFVQAIQESIRNDWQGLFEPKPNGHAARPTTARERLEAMIRENVPALPDREAPRTVEEIRETA